MNKVQHFLTLLSISLSYWRKQTKLKYLPIRLWIEPTNICNLKCIMCPQGKGISRKKGYMEFSLFKKIIDEAKRFIFDANFHHTGESLLHPQLCQMIRYAKSVGIYTRIHTNATLLTEEKSLELINSGLDFISFSFDGYDKESYERIRIGADFNNTLTNIKTFLNIKRSLNKKTPYTVFEEILLPETLSSEHTKKRGELCDALFCLGLNKSVSKQPNTWGSIYLNSNKPQSRPVHYSACTFPWYALVVFWDGTVSPCPTDFFGSLELGNVGESSLSDIWNSKKIIEIRNTMTHGQSRSLSLCKDCDMLARKKIFGIPCGYLRHFISENLLGHN